MPGSERKKILFFCECILIRIMVKRMKRQVADRKKISAHRVSAKDSRQEPMESSEHSAVRNQLNLNLSKSLKRHLTREEMRMANRREK